MEKNLYTPDEPIAAIATALAPAALGIVRASGKNCVELASKIFSRPNALIKAAGNTIVYGWILRRAATTTEKIDEVLVSVFRTPKSFTGEEMIEISCHGGPAVIQAVYHELLSCGFRAAEKGEFTFRAFINGKTDLTRAEAVREIIESKSDASRGRAAGRLAGNVYAEIESVKKLLVDTLAAIEVAIEYPEDEETIADSFDSTQLAAAKNTLQQLVDSWQSEKLYQDGARVVLCGRTNAGKSSLFNELLKEERAIVSNIPGTTRDWIESWTSFSGIPVRLFDTAGLRETEDVIEKQGVELTHSLTQDADAVIYLCDVNEGLADDDKEFLEHCEKPVIFAWNKCDGEAAASENDSAIAKNLSASGGCSASGGTHATVQNALYVSAKTGRGVAELVSAVCDVLTSGLNANANSDSSNRTAALGSARQKASVAEALERIEHALAFVASGDDYTMDAIVQDLEDAVFSLGEVTGAVTSDDILDSVFSNFCVGK